METTHKDPCIYEPQSSSQIERSWHFQMELSHCKSLTIHTQMKAYRHTLTQLTDKTKLTAGCKLTMTWKPFDPKMDQSGFVLCAEQEKLEQVRVVCSTPSLALTLKLWPELPFHTCSPLWNIISRRNWWHWHHKHNNQDVQWHTVATQCQYCCSTLLTVDQ